MPGSGFFLLQDQRGSAVAGRGLDAGDHEVDHRLGRKAGGIDAQGVRCSSQRRDGPFPVVAITLDDLGEQLLFVHLLALAAQLRRPAAGAHLGAGVEVEFPGGPGEDHGARVPPLGDNGAGLADLLLKHGQPPAHQRPGRHPGGEQPHLRGAEQSPDLLAVEEHTHVIPALCRGQQVDARAVEQRGQASLVQRVHTLPAALVGHCPVHGAGIQIGETEPGGQGPGHGGLAAAGRPVDGDDPTTAHSRVPANIRPARRRNAGFPPPCPR